MPPGHTFGRRCITSAYDRHMLDSRHLRTFHEVVTTGSFTAAARSLGYTQPAVTQQIRALEREAGLPLFSRKGGKAQTRTRPARSVLADHPAVRVELQEAEPLSILLTAGLWPFAHPSPAVVEALLDLRPAHSRVDFADRLGRSLHIAVTGLPDLRKPHGGGTGEPTV